MGDEHTLLLGEIKGKLDLVISNQDTQGAKLDGLDSRLRKVETKAAGYGAVAGGMVAVGVALLIEKGKHTLGL